MAMVDGIEQPAVWAPQDPEVVPAALLDAVLDKYSNLLRHTLVQVEGGERLTLPQYRCLHALSLTGSALTTQLARQMEVAVPTMTGRIDGLVARGFVERHPDPADRRQIRLVLTDAGRSHFERCRTEIIGNLEALLNRLQPAQKAQVTEALGVLDQLLDVSRESPAAQDEPAGQ
jgi:DNA-binding MarR family transcriptional regulator